MARPLRIEFAGAFYHVMARGNARAAIFLDDGDRQAFIDNLGRVAERFQWRIWAWCLMGNHYHLLVETLQATLSRGMREVNGVYTQAFNRRHARAGHVFQGRYKSILVERDSYLLELSRYVVLNPVRAGLVASAADWEWSSYRSVMGKAKAPAWLAVDETLALFHTRLGAARLAYARFVAAGVTGADPMEQVRWQGFLGSDAFVDEMRGRVDGQAISREVPRKARPVPTLRQIEDDAEDRNQAICHAYRTGGYTLAEIGAYFGLHYSMISRIVRGHTEKREPATRNAK